MDFFGRVLRTLRERFDREAKAISSLSHPHICPLYDVGNQDGVDFLVMEFLEGETLAHRLKKGPLPPDQVLQYAIQITDALDTAHRHGVVHRDLKPGNIMLVKTGAKLLDFGLAKVRAADPAAGMTALPTQTTPLTVSSWHGTLRARGSTIGFAHQPWLRITQLLGWRARSMPRGRPSVSW